ncbi:hypothetical protein [[Flexibacter] sp. ATCC 35208]|uniref:hypothetical protein n=1 Tax=[Flexibacter] sp. ATCC 35208 TaxID=1936242 RepID=UPI00117FC395|nr:hypothetical protein [[Flexibacter] sp. ATCC 35208]
MTITKQYRLLPEVAGQLGKHTQLDSSVHPPRIFHLHFIFDGWLGDDIIECFPCFLITESMLEKLNHIHLTGYSSKDAEISSSELYKDLHPNRDLPNFKWLIINDNLGDDFFLDKKNYLMVSERAMEILKQYGKLEHCEIEEI